MNFLDKSEFLSEIQVGETEELNMKPVVCDMYELKNINVFLKVTQSFWTKLNQVAFRYSALLGYIFDEAKQKHLLPQNKRVYEECPMSFMPLEKSGTFPVEL